MVDLCSRHHLVINSLYVAYNIWVRCKFKIDSSSPGFCFSIQRQMYFLKWYQSSRGNFHSFPGITKGKKLQMFNCYQFCGNKVTSRLGNKDLLEPIYIFYAKWAKARAYPNSQIPRSILIWKGFQNCICIAKIIHCQ